MRSKAVVELTVTDPFTGKQFRRAVGLEDFPVFSEGYVDDLKSPIGPIGPQPFDSMIRTIRKKEFRKEILMFAAKNLAQQLSEFIEDSEGWHGERRRELIKKSS